MQKRTQEIYDVDSFIKKRKKFYKIDECKDMYSRSSSGMRKLAKEAEAIYSYKSIVLVNTHLVNSYLLEKEKQEKEDDIQEFWEDDKRDSNKHPILVYLNGRKEK